MESYYLDRQYPDTVQGAKQCLKDLSDPYWAPPELIDSAIAQIDPQVKGVWLLKNVSKFKGEENAIVYLAGYEDPFGRVRKMNDFEVCRDAR